MPKKNFIKENYVFLSSMISALILVLQQALHNLNHNTSIDWPSLSYAAFVAIAGAVANEFKGRGITVAGIVGTTASAFVIVNDTGKFTWDQFIVTALIAVLTLFITSFKPQFYERENK